MAEQYTRNQLKLLWFLKRKGGSFSRHPADMTPGGSLLKVMAAELDIRASSVGSILRQLEAKSLVLRHYLKGRASAYASGENNPLIKVEMCDPKMWLPELPPPLPLGVVMQHENNDLYERTAELPSEERVIEALLARIDELQAVIDKLHTVVTTQAEENETLKHQVERLTKPARRQVRDHLYEQVRNRLPPEQAAALEHLNDD